MAARSSPIGRAMGSSGMRRRSRPLGCSALVTGVHDFLAYTNGRKTWMPATSAGMTVQVAAHVATNTDLRDGMTRPPRHGRACPGHPRLFLLVRMRGRDE